MQWHHAEVTRLPEGAKVLASSAVTPVQIMSAGPDIIATQFHGELTSELVDRWAHLPQYLEWLDAALGENAYERVRAEAPPADAGDGRDEPPDVRQSGGRPQAIRVAA